ncbi:MAG: LLM class flavin-dependent oxidoreductase [Bdellovibrionales bacterium]|nr:LLM class flavin-dependent oxidoreductase [Bdellovibrionales bacterium]
MRFSLFFEMQISQPDRKKEAQLFHDCVAQAVLADQVGFDGIWAVEHHGLYEYAHSSAPETFLAFVAAKTKKISIGHGVSLLPGRYNHPIRVAERVATLDILSQGRVLWGTGKSGTAVETGAFEIAPTELESQWREALQMIPKMWTEDIFSWQGKHYNIPPTQIVPKPFQDPHPPIFAACSRPELAVGAGEMGLGVLNVAVYRDIELAKSIQNYRDAIARAKPVSTVTMNRYCCNPSSLVLKNDRKAAQYGLWGSQFFLRSMMNYYLTDKRPTGPLKVSREMPTDQQVEGFMKTRNTRDSQLSIVIGDPVCARESVQRFKDAGVDELILVMQTGVQPHELIMESIRTVAEEVIPHFK